MKIGDTKVNADLVRQVNRKKGHLPFYGCILDLSIAGLFNDDSLVLKFGFQLFDLGKYRLQV